MSDDLPDSVIDARGAIWTRCPPSMVVFDDGEPMTLPAGWKHGSTTYFSLDAIAIANAYGPLRLTDGSPA